MALKEGKYPLEGCKIARGDVVTVKDARIIWLNFSGAKSEFNNEGDRNFNIWLTKQQADELASDGWNVKCKMPRVTEGDEPGEERCVLKVTVSFKVKAPRIIMIGDKSRNRTEITESNVSLLDSADIKMVDLSFTPYFWTMFAGKPSEADGVTAYLKTMYVEVIEDELDMKWAETSED